MDETFNNASRNRTEIAEIKRRYITGEITREEAKALAQPVLELINKAAVIKTKQLNKKYGIHRKPVSLDFINAMRNSY